MKVVRSFAHELDLMTPTEGYTRTPGLHASEIYNALCKKLDPKRYDKRDPKTKLPLPMPEDRVGFGTRFEEALEPQLKTRYQGYRPGEFAVQHGEDCPRAYQSLAKKRPANRNPVKPGDPLCPCGAGIIYSPDYLFFVDGHPPILGEFKLTWMSSKGFPDDPKFMKWLMQVKFYLRNLQMNRVWFFPFWVNGGTDNAYHQCQPEFKRAWDLSFSDGECEQTHQRLLRFARKEGMLK